MKLGLFTVVLRPQPLEKALDKAASLGLEAVELGAGGYAGTDYCDPDVLLRSPAKRKDLLRAVASRGLVISALNAAGNPIHPDPARAKRHHQAYEKAIRLAGELEVPVVINFSGCPGGGPRDRTPNWVTCPWPPDYLEILDYQWDRVTVPYWTRMTSFARRHGVRRLALEMHPGFVVYNPETLLRLRRAAGSAIGANFDPSHLFWQGIDPCEALRALRGAIWHVHGKDTAVQSANARVNGVLDTKHYRDEFNRAWLFRTVGFGHPRRFWCDFVSTLRMCGFDGTISVEHEDSLMTPREGLEKAVAFLQGILLKDPKGKVAWA